MSEWNLQQDILDLPENQPYACLEGCVNADACLDWSSFASKYGLDLIESPINGIVRLSCRDLGLKSQKHEAVILFVAALDALSIRKLSVANLYEVQPLRNWLEAAMMPSLVSKVEKRSAGRSSWWCRTEKSILLCQSITLHLRQAGFSLPLGNDALSLDQSDVRRMLSELQRLALFERTPTTIQSESVFAGVGR